MTYVPNSSTVILNMQMRVADAPRISASESHFKMAMKVNFREIGRFYSQSYYLS